MTTPLGEPLAWLARSVISAATDECIDWPFAVDSNRRGMVTFFGESYRAPAVALTLAGRPFPGGKAGALHSCDRPICVNTRHLRWGSQTDNMADMAARGRQNRARGERSGQARLSEQQVRELRRRVELGERPKRLAGEYGISDVTVYNIINRKTWGHV